MSEINAPPEFPDKPGLYAIRLKGHLNHQWTGWFEGMAISQGEDGDTLLTGLLVDQAALHGILKKVRDIGMSLVSVNPLVPGMADKPENEA